MEIKINIAVESMEDLGKVMDKLEELRKKHNPHCTISANVDIYPLERPVTVKVGEKEFNQTDTVGALTPELKEQLPNFINYKD
jgi:hypothetical protein